MPDTHSKPSIPRVAMPVDLKLLRLACTSIGRVFPRLLLSWVEKAWYRTRRRAATSRDRAFRDSARLTQKTFAHTQLTCYEWGDGPTVLLVHGWNGRASQYRHFVEPLVTAGFHVVGFDAPGHGESSGNHTDVNQYTAAIEYVARQNTPVHSVIAHSFGVPTAMLALDRGLNTSRLVGISPPPEYTLLIKRFCKRLGMGKRLEQLFLQRVEQRFGADVWQRFSARTIAPRLLLPALLIHDRDDPVVPFTVTEELADAWPGCQVMLTQRLGHHRILRDDRVIRASIEFLQHDG